MLVFIEPIQKIFKKKNYQSHLLVYTLWCIFKGAYPAPRVVVRSGLSAGGESAVDLNTMPAYPGDAMTVTGAL